MAVIWYENGVPTVALAVSALVIEGVLSIGNVSGFDAGPLQFWTVT